MYIHGPPWASRGDSPRHVKTNDFELLFEILATCWLVISKLSIWEPAWDPRYEHLWVSSFKEPVIFVYLFVAFWGRRSTSPWRCALVSPAKSHNECIKNHVWGSLGAQDMAISISGRPREVPTEVPRKVTRSVPREVPREVPKEVQREVPREVQGKSQG